MFGHFSAAFLQGMEAAPLFPLCQVEAEDEVDMLASALCQAPLTGLQDFMKRGGQPAVP